MTGEGRGNSGPPLGIRGNGESGVGSTILPTSFKIQQQVLEKIAVIPTVGVEVSPINS